MIFCATVVLGTSEFSALSSEYHKHVSKSLHVFPHYKTIKQTNEYICFWGNMK